MAVVPGSYCTTVLKELANENVWTCRLKHQEIVDESLIFREDVPNGWIKTAESMTSLGGQFGWGHIRFFCHCKVLVKMKYVCRIFVCLKVAPDAIVHCTRRMRTNIRRTVECVAVATGNRCRWRWDVQAAKTDSLGWRSSILVCWDHASAKLRGRLQFIKSVIFCATVSDFSNLYVDSVVGLLTVSIFFTCLICISADNNNIRDFSLFYDDSEWVEFNATLDRV